MRPKKMNVGERRRQHRIFKNRFRDAVVLPEHENTEDCNTSAYELLRGSEGEDKTSALNNNCKYSSAEVKKSLDNPQELGVPVGGCEDSDCVPRNKKKAFKRENTSVNNCHIKRFRSDKAGKTIYFTEEHVSKASAVIASENRNSKTKKSIRKMVVDGKIVEFVDDGKESNSDYVVDESDDENAERFRNDYTCMQSEADEDRLKSIEKMAFFDANYCAVSEMLIAERSAPVDFGRLPFSSHDDSLENGVEAFKWLIAPFDFTTFIETVFQRKALFVSRQNSDYYINLYSSKRFVEILQSNYVEYGINVNVALYKDQKRTTPNGEGRVYAEQIKKLIQDGCSVQFTNPQTFDDKIWYLCDLLQEPFGSFVGANTYITPANSAGFAPHWDDIDAFLMQLEGRKYWKVYAPLDDNDHLPRFPSDNFTDDDLSDQTPVFEGWLESGSLLYIPRGFIHQGRTGKDIHSLHLTVSLCRNMSVADMLEKVVPSALSLLSDMTPELRRSLPLKYLDMAGTHDRRYLCPNGDNTLSQSVKKRIHSLCNLTETICDAAVDMMAREFMKTALPPRLTKRERNLSAVGPHNLSLYERRKNCFTLTTQIKFLRRHGQRLVFENESTCFVIHRMANSRVYEGKPEVLFDLDCKYAGGFATLVDAYPKWCHVSKLACENDKDKVTLAELLYQNGLLMAVFD